MPETALNSLDFGQVQPPLVLPRGSVALSSRYGRSTGRYRSDHVWQAPVGPPGPEGTRALSPIHVLYVTPPSPGAKS